jgi:hypothetical protein
MKYELVKMDGDYVMPGTLLTAELAERIRRGEVRVMPEDPLSDPNCAEIVTGDDDGPSRVIFKRATAG